MNNEISFVCISSFFNLYGDFFRCRHSFFARGGSKMMWVGPQSLWDDTDEMLTYSLMTPSKLLLIV